MAKSLKQLLAEPDDSALCDGVFTRIVKYHGDDIDASAISEAERVVLLVLHVSGIIGNGGFRYLFEGTLKGDPCFALTAEAFQAAGCEKATEAVRKTLAIFPHSRPPTDVEKRLRYYLKRIKGWPTDMDIQFFGAQDDLQKCLANYIRSHSDAFTHLYGRTSKPPKKANPNPFEVVPPSRKAVLPLADLPRWARVAFAARCARQVFPLFARYWPGVSSKRADGVRRAIVLAERSAAEGRAVEGLDKAVLHALMAAGAASRTECAQEEPRPEDAWSGTIASFVAKAAEKAAEAARVDGDESLLAAIGARDYATSAADYAEEAEIAEALEKDFNKLDRSATRGKWTDRTRIPSEIWSMQ
jgi:hypothetical protein